MSLQDGSPARNVPVKLNVLDEPVFVVRGIASVSVEMRKDQQPQTITVRMTALCLSVRAFTCRRHMSRVGPFRRIFNVTHPICKLQVGHVGNTGGHHGDVGSVWSP